MRQPPPIPYVEYHPGERRVLWLTLHTNQHPGFPPVVSIDGRQYIVVWGRVPFEIPADRPVHVSVHMERESMSWAASVLLPPEAPAELTYRNGSGSILGSQATLG